MDVSEASTLSKIAVFCISFSMIATMLCAVYDSGTSDYDYDTIRYYQSQLTEYTGGNLVNETPWVLQSVYTPFIPGDYGADIENHIDQNGWLYGSEITNYQYLNQSVHIKLDPDQYSTTKLSYNDYDWEYLAGEKGWRAAGEFVVEDVFHVDFDAFLRGLNYITDDAVGDGYKYNSGVSNNWNFTGYRYVFDPMLPFSDGASSKDGSLSLVWYKSGEDSGLSGGLQIYKNGRNPSHSDDILLADYSSADIIAGYQSSNGYATTYNFDFEGIILHLSIQFSPLVTNDYTSLRAAWDAGEWDMSISSPSAGNFFDVENSTAFVDSAGSMLSTFIQIYTFDYPKFQGEALWANIVLWLLVGLPMTLGMLFVTMRLVGGVFRFF